jgi:hypothetical protein
LRFYDGRNLDKAEHVKDFFRALELGEIEIKIDIVDRAFVGIYVIESWMETHVSIIEVGPIKKLKWKYYMQKIKVETLRALEIGKNWL